MVLVLAKKKLNRYGKEYTGITRAEAYQHESATDDGNATEGSSSSLPTLSLFCSQEASRLEKEYEASLTKSAKEENLSLQKLIKDITEVSTELGLHPCKFDLKVLEKGNRLAQGLDICVVHYVNCYWMFNYSTIFLT